ncbi:BrnT family toxin [Pseudoduganella sp. LjRoot289]|uniref:BrnT family toxin n=1 Tax=Pseudoduganella sp. LjRoot289 TaxID=3342314 RepID=UPI003ECC8675
MIDMTAVTGFEWDQGNARKNDKHGVTMAESEQVFFNTPLLMLADPKHSGAEIRFHALGRSHTGRRLHISFTLCSGSTLIRVISARDMHRKEREIYEAST